MVYIGMLTDLQQTNLIPNFSTRTEMGSVRQKVGIKNWELQNPPRIDHACFYNSCYVDPYGLDRCGLEPCLASKPEQPEQSERLHSARKSKGCIKKTNGFRRHPRGAARLTKQAAFNFTTLFVSI